MGIEARTPWTGYTSSHAWDEAMAVDGTVREPYSKVYAEIDKMSGEDLTARAEAVANTYLNQGVTQVKSGPSRLTSCRGWWAQTNGTSSPQVWRSGFAPLRLFWPMSMVPSGA